MDHHGRKKINPPIKGESSFPQSFLFPSLPTLLPLLSPCLLLSLLLSLKSTQVIDLSPFPSSLTLFLSTHSSKMPFVDAGVKSDVPVAKPATVREALPAVLVAAFAGEFDPLFPWSHFLFSDPFSLISFLLQLSVVCFTDGIPVPSVEF